MEILWLSSTDIRSVAIEAEDCAAVVRETLLWQADQKVEMPPKLGIHPPAGRHIHAMPAFLPSLNIAGVKWIADFPANKCRGLATLSAVIVLNDPETGQILSIMDAAQVTAIRTAGMTAASLLACGRRDAKVIAIVGTGVVARAHVWMLPRLSPKVEELRIVGRTQESALAFCKELSSVTGVPMQPAPSRGAGVRGSDVVVTVTNNVTQPLLETEWLKEGVTAVVLDNGGKEIRALYAFDRVFVDDQLPFQCEEVRGRFPGGIPRIDGEIGSVLAGHTAGRQSDRERILILNLGIAACDIALAAKIYERAAKKRVGVKITL